jgi:hypothetical protein
MDVDRAVQAIEVRTKDPAQQFFAGEYPARRTRQNLQKAKLGWSDRNFLSMKRYTATPRIDFQFSYHYGSWRDAWLRRHSA